MRTKQAYTVLGVAPGCTRLDARAAYLAKARQLHPDQPGGDADAMAELTVAHRLVQEHVAVRKEPCPACAGHGTVRVGRGFQREERPCKACDGEGKI